MARAGLIIALTLGTLLTVWGLVRVLDPRPSNQGYEVGVFCLTIGIPLVAGALLLEWYIWRVRKRR